MIVELLLALALAQGLTTLAPGATGGGKVLASFPLSTTGALITEDANTVAHVYWNGTALVDTKGNAWAQNGTVPQVLASAANPFTPGKAGAGPFSAANLYTLASPNVLQFAGDFTICTVLSQPDGPAVERVIGSNEATSGFVLYALAGGEFRFDTYGAGPSNTRASSLAASNQSRGIVVVCAGRAGTVQYIKVNLASTVSTPAAKVVQNTTNYSQIGGEYTGKLINYEVYATTTPFTEATVVALQQKVLGHFDGTAPLSVTRATNATYENPAGTAWTAAPGVARITTDGLLVEPARTNYALQSNTMSTGTAATAPWGLGGGSVATVAGAPIGTWAEYTTSASGQTLFQAITGIPSSTTFVVSALAAKASGTGYSSIIANFTGAVSACTCIRSDGGSCTATINPNSLGTSFCKSEVSNLGTTPVRLSMMATSAASTAVTIYLSPGQYGTSAGTTRFSGAQLEVGTYPTSLIVTTTTATARNADVIYATVPAVPSKWCVATTANAAGYDYLWHLGPSSIVNDTVRLQNGVTFAVRDAGGSDKVVTFSAPSLNAAHRYVGCGNAGTLSLTLDGTSTGSVSGAGTGVLTVPPTVFWFGQRSNSASQSAVFLKNLKICKATKAKDCP